MRSSAETAAHRSGYSLAEVVVSLTVFIVMLVGVLLFFNLSYRQARGLGDAAQRQEARRSAQHDLARLVRMAASGVLPRELAIEVVTDVAADTRVAGSDSPLVVAGTDMVTVRGVFSAPLLAVGSADGTLSSIAAGESVRGAVEIHDPSPQTGVAQDLSELAAAIEARGATRDALLLASQLDETIFAVVSGDLSGARIERTGGRVSKVILPFDSGGAAAPLAGAGPAAALRGPAFIGILEEYRIYIRRAHAAPGDESSTAQPQLSIGRFVPGTDRPWGGAMAGLAIDLADNVADLSVSITDEVDGEASVAIALEGS